MCIRDSTAGAAGNVGGPVRFALGDAPHQVSNATFGHHLEGVGKKVFGVHHAGLDLAGGQRVRRALAQTGITQDGQLIHNRLGVFNTGHNLLSQLFILGCGHFTS